MPKIKTNRGAAKRFTKTGKGNFKRAHAYKSHLLTKKEQKQKRRLRAATQVHDHDAAEVQRLLPHI
jgi:large subunit ribosomal protein L35